MTLNPNDDWRDQTTDALMDAIAQLRTAAEAEAFLRDLCTRRELAEMSKRWAVARRLNEGESYRSVSEATGASTATVTRIAQWFHHGTGGYRMMLDRTKKQSRR